jgi:hypothetical protein
MEKRRISCPCWELNPGRPDRSPSLYRLIYPFFLIGIVGGGVQLGPLGTAATNGPIVHTPGDYDDGEIGGMIGRGNRRTRRKPAPVPLCPLQTPHAARARTRAAAVGSQRLTAWATARPSIPVPIHHICMYKGWAIKCNPSSATFNIYFA